MAAGDEQDLIEAVVTCEGNLHDPDFQDRFRKLVAKLKSALYISKTKDPFRVRKIEPWNSVRVTISIPKDAAQKLKLLAQQGSTVLRSMGILSVQVEGDQVISLTWAAQNNETTQVLIRQTNDEAASSSGTSGVSSSSLPASSPSISSISSSVASISSPVPLPLTPGPSGEASGIAVTLDMLSSSPSTLTFRSPNVVAPSGEAIPVLPPKTPSTGVRPALGGPFPFVSMAHAAQAIQRNELSPVLSCNNVVVSNSNISSSNAANSTNSIASSIPSSSLFQGAIKSVQPPQMHLPSTAISNNPLSSSGTPVIVSTSACNVVTAVNVNSESHVTRLIIENPSSLNSTTQMVGGNVASLGISGNNLANSQAGPSQSLQRQLVNVPPPYPGVNTISSKHSLSSSSSNPSGILTSNVQVRHSQQQASLLSNVSGSSPSPNSNLPTIRMVTSVMESHPLMEKTAGGIINNEVPSVAPIADISDSTSGISSLAQPVASPLLVNLLQNNDAPSGSSSSSATSANTDAYNQQLMQKTSNVPSRVVTASSDKSQGRYLIQQQQSKKTKRGLSMDGACSSVPKPVPVGGSVSGSDTVFPVSVPQATSGTDSFQFALPLPSENTSSVTMNRVSVPVTPPNKIGGPLLSNQKVAEQTSAAVLHGRTIMQGNIRILDQGSGQIRTISLQHQQHPPPPPYSTMTSAHGRAVLPGGSIRTHGQPSLRPELVTSATLTNGPLHASLSEPSDGGEVAKSQTSTPITLVQSGEHQTMDHDTSKTAMAMTAALVADQSRTLLPITTVNIVSKSASKPSSVNFNSSKDSDAKTFIPPPDPRMSSQVQRMSQSGSNPVSVKNSASNLVVQTTSCNTDAKSSTSQLNSVGRKRSSKDRLFPISQIPPSGKPRQFLINPLTGHLEPMPCESSSESEEGDDGEGEGGRKSNSHKSSALKNKSSRGPPLLPGVHHRQIVTTESGVTVARVVKGPLLLDPSTAQSHRELDGRKPTNNSGDSSIASSGASIMSVTKKSREDPFTNVALYNQKDAKESNSPSPATVTATSVSGEKIKLRLKLEKSEPISPAYKVDVSFVKKSEKSVFLPNVSSGSSGSGTPSSSATFSSLSGNQSSSGDQPRVPPLHISLRGKNAAVVVSPRREEKDMPPPPPTVGVNTKDPLVNVIAKDVTTSETSSSISSLPSHSKSTSHMLNSHEGKSSNSSKSSGIVKRAKGRVKSLDGTSISSKGVTGEKTKVKASRPKLSKEVSRQDTLTSVAKNQEASKQPLYQFPMPELQPVAVVTTTTTPPPIAMPSAKEPQGFEKTTPAAALSHPVVTTVSPVEIIPSNNNNKCLEDHLSLPAEPPSESCATSFLPSSNSAPDLIAEKEGKTGSQEESAKINSVIEDVILSKSKENMEREAPVVVAFPVTTKSNSPIPPQLELEKNSSHSVTEESPLPQMDDVFKGAFSSSEIPPSNIFGEILEEKSLPESVEPAAVIPSTESSSISKIDFMDPVINPAVDSCDNNSDFGEPSQNSDKLNSKKITEEVGTVNLRETTSTGATNLNRDEQMDESKSSEESKDDNGVAATIPEEVLSVSLTEVIEDKTTEEMDISTDIVKDEESTSLKFADLEELPTVNSAEGSSGDDMMKIEENGGKLEDIAVIEETASSPTASAHPEKLVVDCDSKSNTDSEATADGVSSSSPLPPSNEKPTDLPSPQKIEQLLENEESPKPSGDETSDGDQNTTCLEKECKNEPEAEKVAALVSATITALDKTDCTSKLENDNLEAASVAESEPIVAPTSGSAQEDLAALSMKETPESKLQLNEKIENVQDTLSNSTHQEAEQKEIGGETSTERNLISDEITEGGAKASTPVEDIESPPKLVDSTEVPDESLTLKKSVILDGSSVCEKSDDVPVKVIIEEEKIVPTSQPDKPDDNQMEEESVEQGNNDPTKENDLSIQSSSKDSITVTQAQPEELIDKDVVDSQANAEIVLDDTKECMVEEKLKLDDIPQHQELAEKAAPNVNDITEQKGAGTEVMCSPKRTTSPSSLETNVEEVERVPTIQNACDDATVNEKPSIIEESSDCAMEESSLTGVMTTVVQDDALVDQPFTSLKENDDNNADTIRVDSALPVETIPDELSKKDTPAESSNKCTKPEEEKDETPSETVTSPVLSVPKLTEKATEEPSLIPVSENLESADEDDYNTSTMPDDDDDDDDEDDEDDDPSVNVTIMTPKKPDIPVASTSAPPISIVLPSNNPDGKAGTSKNAYKRRAEIKPGALQNTLKRLHGNFLPKVLKTSDTQDVTSQRTEEDCVDEPPVQVVEPVKATSNNTAMIPITPNKVAVSYATVTHQSPVSIAVSQVRPIMTNVIHRPKVSSTSVPMTGATAQPTLHQISSGLHSNILANVSVALTSSTLTSVTSISVPSTSSGSGPQTVFAIHPNVSIPANFAQLQQSPLGTNVVLPGGHKMVPIKLVTIPKQSGGQLQTIPLGNATPNRSSPNLLEAVNIVANAGSRSSSPKTTLISNAMQSTPLNLSSMSLPVGGNLHFVPISVSSATGTTSNVKVLMTQPIKMQQAGLSQSMVVKSVLMGNQPTTIRVIRPSNFQEPISFQTLMKPSEQTNITEISLPKANISTPETLAFKRDFIVQSESLFKKLDGVEIVETGSPLNNDELPFEADIIHDEKDLADVLASEAKSEMIPMENCANFNISLQNDIKSVEKGPKTKINTPSASATSSIPVLNHVTSKSLLQINRDAKSTQGSPLPVTKRSSPVFTYSSSSAKSSRNRNSPSRTPSPLNPVVPDLHGEDQEIINSFSGSPSLSRLTVQTKSQGTHSLEGKTIPSSELLPDHTYGITSGISITNCGSSNNIDEVLSIEIPPLDLEVAATLSPSQNATEEKRCTRSTRSNTRLSPDITAFVSETPKPTKLSTKAEPLFLKNSPKPSPTGSLKILSPTPSSLTITPSTSTRSSPILNSQHQINASNAAATINAVALGIIDKIQGNATAQNAKNSRISKLSGANKRKRQESDSSSASRDENNEEKAEIDLNSRPGKRKCSENAAEMIKVCIGVEDSPKRNSTSIKKTEDVKSKESKGKKGMGTVVEEDDDADSEVSLSRGRSGRSSRESSEDRSSSRGSSVHRVVSSTATDKPKQGKEEEPAKDTKSSRLNSRLNKDGRPKLKSQSDKASTQQSSIPSKNVKESGQVTTRRLNRPNSKNKSPLTPAKTRTNVRKDAITSNANLDKTATATPSSNANPESENARRKTRSSAAGKRHTT